jgi:hypothetical protein
MKLLSRRMWIRKVYSLFHYRIFLCIPSFILHRQKMLIDCLPGHKLHLFSTFLGASKRKDAFYLHSICFRQLPRIIFNFSVVLLSTSPIGHGKRQLEIFIFILLSTMNFRERERERKNHSMKICFCTQNFHKYFINLLSKILVMYLQISR